MMKPEKSRERILHRKIVLYIYHTPKQGVTEVDVKVHTSLFRPGLLPKSRYPTNEYGMTSLITNPSKFG